MWQNGRHESHAAFASWCRIRDRVESSGFGRSQDAWKWHQTIMEADIAKNYEREYERGKES